jgi:prepilin-type N-terminal cleavage/methylation domain-containing protein
MQKGFTLVELIVVMAVLTVLAVTAAVSLSGVAASANSTGLKSDAAALARQLNLYNALVPEGNRILDKTGTALVFPAAYDKTVSEMSFNDGVLTLAVFSPDGDLEHSVAFEPGKWEFILEWVYPDENGKWAVVR